MRHLPLGVPAEIVLLPQHRSGTGSDRLGNEIATVEIFATTGQKHITRLNLATVGDHTLDWHTELVQIVKIKDRTHYIVSSLISGSVGFGNTILSTGASFGTPRIRNAPVITLANTGAATVPP